jgi:CRISPR-associated endonuclease/helicase Cas3
MNRKIEYIAHRRDQDGKIHGLWDHLEEVSKKCGEFAAKIGLKKQGELIGYLHDIGKASDAFQSYIKSALTRECTLGAKAFNV